MRFAGWHLGFGIHFVLWTLVGGLWLSPTRAAAADRPRRVQPVEFSLDHGCFTEPCRIELSCPTPGARIRFTRDGSAPTESHGEAYTNALECRNTTILRAAAFRADLPPSRVGTRSYLFLADVPRQNGGRLPTTWGTNAGKPVPAYYPLAPEIVNHPAYRDEIVPALRDLPILSLVADPEDLFGGDHGIYAHPTEHGMDWERPVSVELIPHDGSRGFQLDGGVRIQGGWNRRPEESPKHAFRLEFRKRYGAGKLNYPLFGTDGVASFDTLILRAGCNNTWLHWSGEERRRGDFIRDQWMRDSQRALGHPSPRGAFVHLFLNGLYWGLYNPTERPDASFAAGEFGGSRQDYDARNGENILEGDGNAWRELMTRVDRGVEGAADFAAIQPLVDLPALVDYLILNAYGANGDWDGASNWYAVRHRTPPGPFRFFVWDGERTLEGPRDNTLGYDAPDSPPRLFQRLRQNPEFRRLFAERAHRHLGPAGALSPAAAARRYRAWSEILDRAIVAESARWGAYRCDVHPYKTPPYERYTRNDHWRPEVKRLLDEYFPARTANVIEQFRAAGLW